MAFWMPQTGTSMKSSLSQPLEYDPQLFYEVIREFIEQDAEDGE